MMRIAVCEDEPKELELAKQNLQIYLAAHPELEADVCAYTSAMELLCQIENQCGFDILLLDIFLPGILGIEAAQQIRKEGCDCPIIFLTTSRDYAVEAFGVNAVHYLLKPYSSSDFCGAMDKAVEQAQKNAKKIFRITSHGSVFAFDLKSILYVESANHSQFVYSAAEPAVELRTTMNKLYEMLLGTGCDFYRVGAAYIVNLKKIRQLSAKEMMLNGGKKLPIPRGAFPELKEAHMRALFREVGQ